MNFLPLLYNAYTTRNISYSDINQPYVSYFWVIGLYDNYSSRCNRSQKPLAVKGRIQSPLNELRLIKQIGPLDQILVHYLTVNWRVPSMVAEDAEKTLVERTALEEFGVALV